MLSTVRFPEEKDDRSYWDADCARVSSSLWLPQKSTDTAAELSYQTDTSARWMKKLHPLSRQITQTAPISLHSSAIVATKNAAPSIKVIASKKIRFYPKYPERYHQALCLYRRAYNLAIECYQNGTHKDKDGKPVNLRPQIKAICKTEQSNSGRVYNSLICDNAVREAKNTFFAVANKNRGKTPAEGLATLHFKSRKGDIHSFRMCRLPSCLHPAVKTLGEITLTETVPAEADDQSFTVTWNKGRWFLNVQQHIVTTAEKQGPLRCVAVDPGVRTFATCYSPADAIIAGEHIAKQKLFPLMKQVDSLISQRQKIWNGFKDVKFADLPQWARDRLTHIQKKIYRLKWQKEDLVSDLHLRLGHHLTECYDAIFLPHFRTKSMVRRKKGRVIRRNTCRQMLDLCHYQFKLLLKWLAVKKGKYLVDCNESWTSKTLSYSGKVIDNLGGRKTILDGDKIIDRDLNAARGIFIKTFVRFQTQAT